MAECIVLKGGNGADLDVITAGVTDVLTGKVIVDKDGNPLTGTMANNGAVSQTLNAGGSYTIPTGYHNGSGKVTANSLASQTSGTAAAAQILSGYTAWANGSKLTGNIASLSGQTITPSASQYTVSSSGKYMTGNVVVNAVSNLSAGNVKKGVVVGGVTGTWEGYVPTATDLYIRGTNSAGFYGVENATKISFYTGQVTFVLYSGSVSMAAESINLTGYSYVNVEFQATGFTSSSSDSYLSMYLAAGQTVDSRYYAAGTGVTYTASFSVSAYQGSGNLRIKAYRMGLAIFRIWLS